MKTDVAFNVQTMLTPPAANGVAAILQARQITKVFPGTVALDKVDFNVYQGKVNVLIGENGAGKSTLMKIIAGVEQPTNGEILIEGRPVHYRSPLEASRAGIGIIYQELDLFPNLTVTENIFMARDLMNLGVTIDARREEKRVHKLLQRLEQDIDPKAPVGDLRLGQQQIVAIAKALVQDVRILIMDEPTSALSSTEVTVLFRIISELKAQGVSIVYISHKLEELMQIGDYLTVLRDGQLQAEARVPDVLIPWIIEKMVGREAGTLFQKQQHATVGNELLRIEEMTLPRPGGGSYVDHVSLTLHKGEILGIYGLMGAGRTELFESLIGLHPEAHGQIFLNGQLVKASTIAQRIDLGIVLVPEDRQTYGLVQTLSVASNLTLANLKKFVRAFVLLPRQERQSAQTMIHDLAIKVSNANQPVTALSGGNQQKVVVGKGLMTSPKVLILDEPTRGIDVGAKAEMFHIMSQLAAQGYGVLFASSELNEVLAMSDRILVMSKGKITGEFADTEATEEKLVTASAIGHGPHESFSEEGKHDATSSAT
jgi:erythritol transport system ATP-binding protein